MSKMDEEPKLNLKEALLLRKTFQPKINEDFLLLYEPPQSDLKLFPFLNGLGGLLKKFRHPVLCYWCEKYNELNNLRTLFHALKQEWSNVLD